MKLQLSLNSGIQTGSFLQNPIVSHLSDQRCLSVSCCPSAQNDRQLVAVEMAFEADPFPLNSLVTARCDKTVTFRSTASGIAGQLHHAFIFQQPLGLRLTQRGAHTLMYTHINTNHSTQKSCCIKRTLTISLCVCVFMMSFNFIQHSHFFTHFLLTYSMHRSNQEKMKSPHLCAEFIALALELIIFKCWHPYSQKKRDPNVKYLEENNLFCSVCYQ